MTISSLEHSILTAYMQFRPDSTIKDVMSSLIYCTGHTIPHVNPIIPLHYSTLDAILKIMTDIKIEFAPGLKDVLLSKAPPTISFIKSLPLPDRSKWPDIWANYGILQEAPPHTGLPPLFYIGKTSPQTGGIVHRMGCYHRNDKAGQPVEFYSKAHLGYKTTHIGLLSWCPSAAKLDASLVSYAQTMLVTVECTLAFALWAQRSRLPNAYGMGHLRR